MRDFMSLLASFSGKYYRLRGKANSRKFLEQVEADLNDDNGSAGGES